MRKRIALEIEGNLDALRIVWTLLEEVLGGISAARFKEEDRFSTMVAVQEIVTNVLRHAYHGDFSQPIRMEIEAEGSRVQVTTIDSGPAFNPAENVKIPTADTTPEGGYGIFIMRSIMDDFSYRLENETNILVMTKDFAGSPILAGTEPEDRQ